MSTLRIQITYKWITSIQLKFFIFKKVIAKWILCITTYIFIGTKYVHTAAADRIHRTHTPCSTQNTIE